MFDLIKAFRTIPEETKLVVYGRVAMIKNLCYFCFKIIVGLVFKSWLLIAIAIYNLMIGIVKENCSRGLKQNKEDNITACQSYIRGGVILSISSVFYVAYTIIQMFFPSNSQYHMIIAIAIAAFATYSITTSIIGVVRTKGKTMLIKEYKFTNFATAFNNIVLAQIAILSFTTAEDMTQYNTIIGLIVGSIILFIGLYLVCDGLLKKRKLEQQKNP